MNGTSMIIPGIAIFILGAACGARIVYRFRHVTTKALHQAILNTLRERTPRLDRFTQSASEPEMVAIDLEEDQPDFGSEMAAMSNDAGVIALRVYGIPETLRESADPLRPTAA